MVNVKEGKGVGWREAEKRLGKRRDWLFEQVEDGPVGGVPEWLR